MKSLVSLALLCVFCPALPSQSAPAAPATPARTKLYFECQCDDDAAARFATAFRDIIAVSPRYVLANAVQETRAGEKYSRYNWHLKVLSLDTTNDDSGAATALSEVLLIGDSIFATQSVQLCGRSKAAECAQTTFAWVDKYINSK